MISGKISMKIKTMHKGQATKNRQTFRILAAKNAEHITDACNNNQTEDSWQQV